MLYVGLLPSLVGDGVCPIPSTAFWFCYRFSRLEYVRLLKRNRNYIVITNNCVNWLSNYDVGMQAGIVREKETNTLRQCVFPFHSKKVCTLFLPLVVLIQSSAVWSEQDFGPGEPGAISRCGGVYFFSESFFFNYGEIYGHPTSTTCLQVRLQDRCMNAVRDLYR